MKVGAFGKERLVYHGDYCVHEDYGFCRYLANEFLEEDDADPNEITLEFRVRVYVFFPRPTRREGKDGVGGLWIQHIPGRHVHDISIS